ncbi:hypothetical protein DERP_007601 [Dermatophagoides pteronyssinus]|uniref:Uncharacterized protein n=1 Tax=Dermatophagoides pteronyssinus TaxID=6956 RepID=A0ABQ8JKT6_DERPT|nr:hypothetical protein DERP_007601 [Dermatophagoides pteronyssinus]
MSNSNDDEVYFQYRDENQILLLRDSQKICSLIMIEKEATKKMKKYRKINSIFSLIRIFFH